MSAAQSFALTFERFGIQREEARRICERTEALIAAPFSWGKVHFIAEGVWLFKDKTPLLHVRHAALDPKSGHAVLCEGCPNRWNWETGACLNKKALDLPLSEEFTRRTAQITDIFYRSFPQVLSEKRGCSFPQENLWLMPSGRMYAVPELIAKEERFEIQGVFPHVDALDCVSYVYFEGQLPKIVKAFEIVSKFRSVVGIVQVKDIFFHEKYYWIEEKGAMNLKDFCLSGEKPSFRKKWVEDLLRGLTALHASHCAHKNIRPETMVIARDFKRAFFVEFECIEQYPSEKAPENRFRGETAFFSPEKVRHLNQRTSQRGLDGDFPWRCSNEKASDIWAFGLALGEAMGFFDLSSLRKLSEEDAETRIAGFTWHDFFPERPSENTLEFLIYRMLQPEFNRIKASEALELFLKI